MYDIVRRLPSLRTLGLDKVARSRRKVCASWTPTTKYSSTNWYGIEDALAYVLTLWLNQSDEGLSHYLAHERFVEHETLLRTMSIVQGRMGVSHLARWKELRLFLTHRRLQRNSPIFHP